MVVLIKKEIGGDFSRTIPPFFFFYSYRWQLEWDSGPDLSHMMHGPVGDNFPVLLDSSGCLHLAFLRVAFDSACYASLLSDVYRGRFHKQ
jgi:hypothetical protein